MSKKIILSSDNFHGVGKCVGGLLFYPVLKFDNDYKIINFDGSYDNAKVIYTITYFFMETKL